MMKGLLDKIDFIERKLRELFSTTRQGFVELRKVMEENNPNLIKKLEEIEKKSDEINLLIFRTAADTIALYAPVAHTMRYILGTMQISSFCERVCDLIYEIGEFIPFELDKNLEKIREEMLSMIDNLRKMLEIIETAFEKHEIDKIDEKLTELDTKVDNKYNEIKEQLAEYVTKKCTKTRTAFNMLLSIRYLERIGDIIAKMGARLIFIEENRIVFIK